MKKVNYRTIFFNIIEALMIFLIGFFIIKCPIQNMFLVLALFVYIRESIGGAKHYKNMFKCMIWSVLVISTLFMIINTNLVLGIAVTIFAGVLLSKGGDIPVFEYVNDKQDKKCKELELFIEKYKNDEKLKKFENILKNINYKYQDIYKIDLYKVYVLHFYEEYTYKEIIKEMKLRDDNHIISNALNNIFISFNTYIEINEYNKEKELAKLS